MAEAQFINSRDWPGDKAKRGEAHDELVALASNYMAEAARVAKHRKAKHPTETPLWGQIWSEQDDDSKQARN